MEFEECDEHCQFKAGKLGFIAKDYYPSTPIHPAFAVHVRVLDLYYAMNQMGPSSKYVYANALQRELQKHAQIKVIHCMPLR